MASPCLARSAAPPRVRCSSPHARGLFLRPILIGHSHLGSRRCAILPEKNNKLRSAAPGHSSNGGKCSDPIASVHSAQQAVRYTDVIARADRGSQNPAESPVMCQKCPLCCKLS
ncbi:hypothetical protein AAFF_G00007480 [Aldrovandia affinis]|uniref:Uncharacterized protein n=1 Tax=Aldrovandia affinis TaxID=143900 RepID=A0AAD7WZS8_9TELE|nr:hypothetical protein AAFF_G00007480 [Aldrovandia affinis]